MGSDYGTLIALNQSGSLAEKLAHLHQSTREYFPFITRMSLALYDEETDLIRTFVYSGELSALNHYQARLNKCFSLRQLAETDSVRLVQDLAVFSDSKHIHAQKIYAAGYRGSYTVPVKYGSDLVGFVFFNTDRKQAFTEACIDRLDLVADLIGMLLHSSLNSVRTLMSTVKSAVDLTHFRDPETGAHLHRMSRYARTIARALTPESDRDDQFSEYLYLFSPLHDLGKITIPDSILLKPGKLTEDEFEIMKTHAANGGELARKLVQNFKLEKLKYLDVLFNVVVHHHEAWDGNGYPSGLKGESIPLEARIVAVADVYDALTSKRPYKEAWSQQEALNELNNLSGQKLDPNCVRALIDNLDEINRIQLAFPDVN